MTIMTKNGNTLTALHIASDYEYMHAQDDAEEMLISKLIDF